MKGSGIITKQEEIREGQYELIADALARGRLDTGVGINELIAEMQKFEVSKGVVIKVDENRLPDISYHSAYPENEEIYQQAMLKAGCGFFEDLI